MLNHIKTIALLSSILFLTSVGAKAGGLFSSKLVRLIGIDEQYVGGFDGVVHSKVVNLEAGNRELVVEFSSGSEYVGREYVSFEAVRDVDYMLAFEYPVTASMITTSTADASGQCYKQQ